jgi:hypothetical protein
MNKVVFKINGKVVSAKDFRRHRLHRMVPSKPGDAAYVEPFFNQRTPRKSTAMSCHSSEIPLMNQAIKDHGIAGVEYVPQFGRRGQLIGGKCMISDNSSRTGRRAWMKVYGRMCGLGALDEDN